MPALNHGATTAATRTRLRPSGGFDKVSLKRRCRICNHADWCVFSRDGRTSVCMRKGEGARRRSKPSPAGQGWVHVHADISVAVDYQPAPVRAAPASPLAPLEVRDAIYRELIRISPATRYR